MKNIYSIKAASRLLCSNRLSCNHALPKHSLWHKLTTILLVLTASSALSGCDQLDTLFGKSKKSGIGKASQQLTLPLNTPLFTSDNPAITIASIGVGVTAVNLFKAFSCTAKNEPSFSVSGDGKGNFRITAGSIQAIKTKLNDKLRAQLHVTCPTTSSHAKDTLSVTLKMLQTNKVSSILQTKTSFPVVASPFYLPALFTCADRKQKPNFSISGNGKDAFVLKEKNIQMKPDATQTSAATLTIICPATKGFEQGTLDYTLEDARSPEQQTLATCIKDGFDLQFANPNTIDNTAKLENGVYKHSLGTMRAEPLPIIVSLASTEAACNDLTQTQIQDYLGYYGSLSYESEDTTRALVTPKGVVYPLPTSLSDDKNIRITLTYTSTELGKTSGGYAINVSGVNPTWAYSLRKLFASDEKTYAIQIKNNEDQTADIGFTDEGDLDIVAAIDFANKGNAYIVKWYNQVKNEDHVTPEGKVLLIANGNPITLGKQGRPALRSEIIRTNRMFRYAEQFLRLEVLGRSAVGQQPGVLSGFKSSGKTELLSWNTTTDIPESVADDENNTLERSELIYYQKGLSPDQNQRLALKLSALRYWKINQ